MIRFQICMWNSLPTVLHIPSYNFATAVLPCYSSLLLVLFQAVNFLHYLLLNSKQIQTNLFSSIYSSLVISSSSGRICVFDLALVLFTSFFIFIDRSFHSHCLLCLLGLLLQCLGISSKFHFFLPF
jgi:hypothetical protein